MKLYDLALSPFAARVRLQVYAKGLAVERLEPPGGLASDAYKKINPTGKVPALELEDGSVLPESSVIAEYLEDRFPEPSLRPADPATRARMRLLVHLCDLYVVPRGVMHRPVAESEEVHVMLIEPKGEPNSGDPATAATKVWI